MRTATRAAVLFIAALISIAAASGTAMAATYNIVWLDQSPVPVGTSVPNNSVFVLPGVGNVTVTYSIPATFTDARSQNACLQNGNVVLGPDTWNWTAHELFASVLNSGPDPLVPVQWTITYTFPGTLPAGSVYVGIAGLGATTSFGGGTSSHAPWGWVNRPASGPPGGRSRGSITPASEGSHHVLSTVRSRAL